MSFWTLFIAQTIVEACSNKRAKQFCELYFNCCEKYYFKNISYQMVFAFMEKTWSWINFVEPKEQVHFNMKKYFKFLLVRYLKVYVTD